MGWVGWMVVVIGAIVVIEFLRDHPRVSEAIGAGFALLCFLLVVAGIVLFIVKGSGCDQSGGVPAPTYNGPPPLPNDHVIPPGGLDPPSAPSGVGGLGGVGM